MLKKDHTKVPIVEKVPTNNINLAKLLDSTLKAYKGA
jgi:hypothetical protein